MSLVPVFCTLFDENYLAKGVVLAESLATWCPGATLHVLAMDEVCESVLRDLRLPGVTVHRLADYEDAALLAVKPTRSRAEYCWTLGPSFIRQLFERLNEVQSLTYVDADLMFFSSLSPIFDEIGDASVSVIEHRYPPRLAHLVEYGKYNVEWLTFRRDVAGLSCLDRWREQCLEWCYARVESGRMGDQKYLDEWPDLLGESLHVIQDSGAGIAPWNVFDLDVSFTDGRIFVQGAPLIFYHFHQFQILSDGGFDRFSQSYSQGRPCPDVIYESYEGAIARALEDLRAVRSGFNGGVRSRWLVALRRAVQRWVPSRLKAAARRAGLQPW